MGDKGDSEVAAADQKKEGAGTDVILKPMAGIRDKATQGPQKDPFAKQKTEGADKAKAKLKKLQTQLNGSEKDEERRAAKKEADLQQRKQQKAVEASAAAKEKVEQKSAPSVTGSQTVAQAAADSSVKLLNSVMKNDNSTRIDASGQIVSKASGREGKIPVSSGPGKKEAAVANPSEWTLERFSDRTMVE